VKFTPLPIAGAYAVQLELHEDQRGFFARSFCQREFAEHDLVPLVAQCNVSWNRLRGTLRGIHFQRAPQAEVKLVRCTRGAAWDVVVDLRAGSPTFRGWTGIEINAENRIAVYVPAGCGHGFQTLCDDTELFYQMSEYYDPESAGGIRWNDPVLSIDWPVTPVIVSERDSALPGFQP
jgi:dTDP-4-dehydrorhamnose 3,5-epimerase